MKNKLGTIIIDGNLLAHRAFHKMDFLQNSRGEHTGMEFGFLRSLESLQRKFAGHEIIICFDTKSNKKKEGCERYKANRSIMKEGFYNRLSKLQEFLNCFWDLCWQYGEEADDVMYSLALETGGLIYLYSNDNDLLQCVTKKTLVLKSHDSTLFIWDDIKVRDKFGLPPELLVMFRSFTGDKTDNLDGVPRIQKRILVDAILGAVGGGITDPFDIATHISGATSWSLNMSFKLQEFMESGLWQENYDLMKLQACDYKRYHVDFTENYVVECLKRWEIGSLDLCKEFKNHLVDTESEF